jgi:hypothetical protein
MTFLPSLAFSLSHPLRRIVGDGDSLNLDQRIRGVEKPDLDDSLARFGRIRMDQDRS